MNLIDTSNLINEALEAGFKRVEVKARDYKNRCHIIEFRNDCQDKGNKIIHIANMLGDGHRIINILIE